MRYNFALAYSAMAKDVTIEAHPPGRIDLTDAMSFLFQDNKMKPNWFDEIRACAEDGATDNLIGDAGERLLEKLPYLAAPCDTSDKKPTYQELFVRAFSGSIQNDMLDPVRLRHDMMQILRAIEIDSTPH